MKRSKFYVLNAGLGWYVERIACRNSAVKMALIRDSTAPELWYVPYASIAVTGD